MMTKSPVASLGMPQQTQTSAQPDDALLDRVFFALSDPVRRGILGQLDGQALLVSELAAPFAISLQAVSRHIQVLVRAGLVQQERTGRISRCRLEVGPMFGVAVWINRYTQSRQEPLNLLTTALESIEEQRTRARKRRHLASKPAAQRSR